MDYLGLAYVRAIERLLEELTKLRECVPDVTHLFIIMNRTHTTTHKGFTFRSSGRQDQVDINTSVKQSFPECDRLLRRINYGRNHRTWLRPEPISQFRKS